MRNSQLLLSCGYKHAHADHRLFIKSHGSDFTALIIYVDDIVLPGNSVQEIDDIKCILHSNFHIKDLGQLKYFLGIEVAHSTKGISLCQRKYCLDLLKDTACLAANHPLHQWIVPFAFMLIVSRHLRLTFVLKSS